MAAGEGATAPEGGRIRVAIRCRPFNERERAEGAADEAALECCETAVTLGGFTKREGKTFSYDHVFGSEDGQEAVFEAVGLPLLENALNAYNGCIFAYGQTGAGKSYSVVGDLSSDAEKGILPRSCERLFELLDERRENDSSFQATVLASYLEIYNEKLFDLLSGGGRDPGGELQVRLHPTLGAIVVNLTECPMQSFSEALELFDFGAKRRAVGATQMNATSSRSHAVFTIQVRMLVTSPVGSVESQAKIHFVDLAGSEKQKKSGATGARLKEGIGINQSLTTLGRVISDLTKPGSKGLPPFRDSKLTLLLKDALMGNSRTELLACISPSRFNLEETISTLEFASRCKLVKTSARKNEQSRGDIIVKLTAEKEQIEAQLLQERALSEERCKQLQEELERAEEEKQRTEERAISEKREVEEKLKQLQSKLDDNFNPEEKERLLQEMEDLQKQREQEKEESERQREQLREQLEELDRTRALLREKEELLQDGAGQRGGDEEVPDEQQEQREQEATRREEELRSRLEEERTAQQAREEELQAQMEALKNVQDSWTLDREELEQRREAQHRHREAELSKLGMHFTGVDSEDMPNAPRLVNLHPDPALKGCLVYYLPIGETAIGSDEERCQVRLAGLGVGAQVCAVANEDNAHLTARALGGGLVRVNGSLVGEDGRALHDGDRLAIGRAYIFRVHVPRDTRDEGVTSHAESEFERAMNELVACAEVDPQWENGVQKAMLLVKSDFGTEAANELLAQARRASEAIAMANTVLQEMPGGWTDGVAKFELSVLFDAHGLPEVCVVARRGAGAASAGGRPGGSSLRSGGQSAGIWEVDRFVSERLPVMHEALMLARAEESPSVRHWESRVWSELSVLDYKALLDELPAPVPERQPSSKARSPSPETAEKAHGWSWLSGAAAHLKQNVRAVKHAVKDTAALKDAKDVPSDEGHGRFSIKGSLKGAPTAQKLARAVSPAKLLRSVSAGRLERGTGHSSRGFAPPARSGSGAAREPMLQAGGSGAGAPASGAVRSSLRDWRQELEQQFGPPLAASPVSGMRGGPAGTPKGSDRTPRVPGRAGAGCAAIPLPPG